MGRSTSRSSWAASGARPARVGRSAGPRPAGSFSVAIGRAREAWDGLTGGPNRTSGRYSETAAAAILDTALRLWGDTAASMGGDAPADEPD